MRLQRGQESVDLLHVDLDEHTLKSHYSDYTVCIHFVRVWHRGGILNHNSVLDDHTSNKYSEYKLLKNVKSLVKLVLKLMKLLRYKFELIIKGCHRVMAVRPVLCTPPRRVTPREMLMISRTL